MRGHINDFLRVAIAWGIRVSGLLLNVHQAIKLRLFRRYQANLRRRFGITRQTPLLSYGPEIERLITAVARKHGGKARFAFTSGSTDQPKRLLYTQQRLNRLKRCFSEVFCRACWHFRVARTSLYIFSTVTHDASLTTMVLDELCLPSYLSTLQAPYRLQRHKAIAGLVESYGEAAVHLWLLTISNPGFLYSTNPSSMLSFFDEVNRDWLKSRQLVRDWQERQQNFDPVLAKIARRIESRGSSERISRVSLSQTPLPVTVFAPRARLYMCWTGGYVKPFLDRLTRYLPESRFQLVPMYSMSTETVETATCLLGDRVSFLPVADGVVYEFIEEGKSDDPKNLLSFDQLEIGTTYSMVVSNAFGLRRYQTDDLFCCQGKVLGFPDLSFVRRRSLEHSFTGEKLTGEQLGIVFRELKEGSLQQFQDTFLTCLPCLPMDHALPYYRILAVSDVNAPIPDVAKACDQRLCELNIEYRNKRLSARLGAVEFERITNEEFIRRFPNSREPQFKFLPLLLSCREVSGMDLRRAS